MADALRFALFGHPVEHSVSPEMCRAAFSAMRLPHQYTARDVLPGDLRRAVDDLRSGALAGANVTIPHKRSVIDLCAESAASVRDVGAANVLVVQPGGRVIAHNTDAEALSAELADLTEGLPKLRAAVIGSGGAGLAAIVACKRLGYKVVGVTSRSWTSSAETFELPAARQARALGALTFPWPEPGEMEVPGNATRGLRLHWRELVVAADCIVQATSAGMRGAGPGEDVSSIVPWNELLAHAVVYDVVYTPRVTPFLREAAVRRIPSGDGLGMLVRQAGLAIRLWTGIAPPEDVMRDAAEAALDSRGESR